MNRDKDIDTNDKIHCPVCGEVTEKEIEIPVFNGKEAVRKMVHCMCRCERSAEQLRKQQLKFEEDQRRINRFRQLSLMDERLKNVCFQNCKVTQDNKKAFGIAKKYVENFDEMISRNQGLLFWGNVGTGKSYMAACIANELIERAQPVIMTSFIKLLNELMRFGGDDGVARLSAADYVRKLNFAKLLVIDDLGAERGTDYAIEKVYDVIDSRYRSGKPIILTTNLTMSQMKNCDDVRYSRIYDRIFEMCYPVKMEGLSWRKMEAAARFADTKKILEG